jgi:hypothetical protein
MTEDLQDPGPLDLRPGARLGPTAGSRVHAGWAWTLLVGLGLAGGLAGLFAHRLWPGGQKPADVIARPTATALSEPAATRSTPAPEPAPIAAAEPSQPASTHPPPVTAEALPELDRSDTFVKTVLTGLLGSHAVSTFLVTDDFARRFVATVDNLGREHAAAGLWPVKPMSSRPVIVEYGDGPGIASGNDDRYAPFVRLLSSVDAATAVTVYQRLYPLFQQAYAELGYSGSHLNDRVLEVMDQMLDTPESTWPIRLVLTEIQGPYPSTRPWTRYEFADPALEARPAGQKLLLRMGAANARAIKLKLAEMRVRVAEFAARQ